MTQHFRPAWLSTSPWSALTRFLRRLVALECKTPDLICRALLRCGRRVIGRTGEFLPNLGKNPPASTNPLPRMPPPAVEARR